MKFAEKVIIWRYRAYRRIE